VKHVLQVLVAITVAAPLATAQDQGQSHPGRGQATALARLNEVLPEAVAAQVIQIVTDATSRGLPGAAIATRALEGAAKGRSGEEVRAAAQQLAGDLAAGRSALRHGGRSPDGSEIEAAAAAMSFGVDGHEVSALASSAPSGRSLAVPLAVIGALVNRGLPSDAALAAVLARLEAHAGNAELAEMPGDAGTLVAQGMRPAEVGLALAAQRSGRTVPAGPPPDVPRNGGRPGERPQSPTPPARP
jgi:hypothetical protein